MPENSVLSSRVHSEYIDYLASGLEKKKSELPTCFFNSYQLFSSMHFCVFLEASKQTKKIISV